MPYLATPSWLRGGPDQAEQKPASSTGGAGVVSGPPGSAPAGGAAAPPGQNGTGFVNLSAYMDANRPQAEAYAQSHIVDPLNQRIDTTNRQAQGYANQRASVESENAAGRAGAQAAQKGYQSAKDQFDRAQAAWGAIGQGSNQRFYFDSPEDFAKALDAQEYPTATGSPFVKQDWSWMNNDAIRGWRGHGQDWLKAYNGGRAPDQPAGWSDREMPAVPGDLAGRASSVNADRRAAGTMAGRAALFNRSAGQGYGFGNFDTFLSGSNPWGQVSQYPTLWQQMTAKKKGER